MESRTCQHTYNRGREGGGMGLQHVGKRTVLSCWSATHAIHMQSPCLNHLHVRHSHVRHRVPKQQYPDDIMRAAPKPYLPPAVVHWVAKALQPQLFRV